MFCVKIKLLNLPAAYMSIVLRALRISRNRFSSTRGFKICIICCNILYHILASPSTFVRRQPRCQRTTGRESIRRGHGD